MKFLLLIPRNIVRNPMRSILSSLVTIVLVFVVTAVWSILALLDYVTQEKSENFRALVTERWSIPSRMPFSYGDALSRGAARRPGDIVPTDSMTWQFFVGTLDKEKITRENLLFCIAVEPSKVLTMMDGLDLLEGEEHAEVQRYVDALDRTRQGVILGRNHAVNLLGQAQVAPEAIIGKRINASGLANFKGLELELEVVGLFPAGRYDTLAAIHRDYYNNSFDAYERKHGQKHPHAARNLNLVWLKVPDTASFDRLAAQIESAPDFRNPAVKCETAASGYASFLGGFRDLIWGMRWLLAPACLFTILLVIANAISISVRERRLEMAVLKVLGFRPWQIVVLVLGESILLGAGSGFISSAGTYALINLGMGGLKFPVAFFDRFLIPEAALWWGPAVGGLAALLGSFLPAWSARNVKVADVFAKVA
jgi:putative ABC transport system permease protein